MIKLDGDTLNLTKIRDIIFHKEDVGVQEKALDRLRSSKLSLDRMIGEGRTIYGVNTGFGSLYNVKIPDERISELQRNLVRSHASGVGNPLSPAYVRSMMLIRANTFLKGFSGLGEGLLTSLVQLINSGLVPYVPEIGSVGASGDLAPLSHVALCVMGEGEFLENGTRVPAEAVLRKNGLNPYSFSHKEGVAFINGTAAISGVLAVELLRAYDLFSTSLLSASFSFSALHGNKSAFTDWAVESRPHKGQATVARIMRGLLSESGEGHRIQDPYSLRCIPQVHGAVLDTIEYARAVLETEMNSATDNPLVGNDEVISAGNFHGEPVAFVCDFLAIALTDLGNICERRIAMLVDANLSGLPPFLTEDSGTSSGYMIPQYVAAALCNYNKTLSHPASVDTIPTSANQEDHVSMGMTGALKLSKIVSNLKQILSIEMLLAIHAAEMSNADLGPDLKAVRDLVRKRIDGLTADRPPYVDIERMSEIISSREFVEGVLGKITLL